MAAFRKQGARGTSSVRRSLDTLLQGRRSLHAQTPSRTGTQLLIGKRSVSPLPTGIFAYMNYRVPRTRKEIFETLIKGLQRLEYRGYDSAGRPCRFPVAMMLPSHLKTVEKPKEDTGQKQSATHVPHGCLCVPLLPRSGSSGGEGRVGVMCGRFLFRCITIVAFCSFAPFSHSCHAFRHPTLLLTIFLSSCAAPHWVALSELRPPRPGWWALGLFLVFNDATLGARQGSFHVPVGAHQEASRRGGIVRL